MGCLKLSYYQQERGLEVNALFLKKGLEKNVYRAKNCLSASRYGFQGQETDFEVKNITGGSVNYKYRMHDPRLGRFFARDPLAAKYPHNSPYAFSENRVIDGVELEGLEVALLNKDGDLKQGPLNNQAVEDMTSKGYLDLGSNNIDVVTANNGNIIYNNKYKDYSSANPQVFSLANSQLVKIGELGGNIDMLRTELFGNKLIESTNIALGEDFGNVDWVESVSGGEVWDLKANKSTIWGVAWAYDKISNNGYTSFSYGPSLQFSNAADVGNYHAGWTGAMTGVPVIAQQFGAGAAEFLKNIGDGNFSLSPLLYIENNTITMTYGDRKRDHYWNTQGMSDAFYYKKKIGSNKGFNFHLTR